MKSHVVRIALLLAAIASPRVAECQPNVKFFYPPGGQVGTKVDVQVNGEFPNWPIRIWVNRPGVVAAARSDEKEQHKLSVDIAPEATPGIYWLRLYDDSGSSTPQPFVVGRLPEVLEQESNNATDSAQSLREAAHDTRSVTVNGRLEKRGDVDVYAIDVAKGQTLVADIDAHLPLGSAVDSVLQILGPSGFVNSQIDDHHSLDPRLAYVVPREGTWFIRVFGFPATPTSSIRFAGDPAYVYRLTVSTGPFVDHALPLAAHKTEPTEFRLFGWNLDADQRQITLAEQPESDRVLLHTDGLTRSIQVPVVQDHLIVEAEPCSEPEPIAVELPATITGRIQQTGDRDAFLFNVDRNQTVIATLESRSLGYPLDGVIELLDADGKQLARNDDSGGVRDAALNHRVGSDGPLRLVVSDLHRKGGDDFVYRLRLRQATPDFRLSLADHQVKLKTGEKLELAVNIDRSHGHARPISISAEGLPEGVSVNAVESTADDDTKKIVKLTFEAAATAGAASIPIRISGNDGTSEKLAKIPGGTLIDLWLTVAAED